MTHDDIIRMAREAGGIDFTTTFGPNVTVWIGTATPEFLARFAALVAAHEREACAKVADLAATRNYPWGSENTHVYHAQADWAEKIAQEIRLRGEVRT